VPILLQMCVRVCVYVVRACTYACARLHACPYSCNHWLLLIFCRQTVQAWAGQNACLIFRAVGCVPHQESASFTVISRVGQNRIYAPYMTVYLAISLPKIPYIHRIYMVLANPSHKACSLDRQSWFSTKLASSKEDVS